MVQKQTLFFLLVCIWIGLSLLAVSVNAMRFVTDYREWGVLTDTQKRQKLFGERYTFSILMNEKTNKNAHILFYTDDEMAFYISRYYLYPKTIIFEHDKKKAIEAIKEKKFPYLAFFNRSLSTPGYEVVGSLPNGSNHKAYIYKKL